MEIIEDEVEKRSADGSRTIALTSFVDLLFSNLGFSNLREHHENVLI